MTAVMAEIGPCAPEAVTGRRLSHAALKSDRLVDCPACAKQKLLEAKTSGDTEASTAG